MLDRSRVKQSSRPRRPGVGWAILLTWLLTLLIAGSFGVALSGLYGAYRAESAGGLNRLAATPYQPEEQARAKQEKRAAIIVDDLGSDMEVASGFLDLQIPITVAILPYQRYSRRVASEAVRQGKEVILHLPMQPRDYPAVNPGAGALLLSMNCEETQAEVAQQLDALPRCVGVSNHMGSLFTEQEERMRWVLSVVRERHLFFLDSLTTPNSSARSVAAEMGLPFAQRTHFLDVDKAEDSIVRQLCRVVDSAVRDGGAIAIAHPSAETLAALPKVVSAFAEKDVRLVPVSQMVASYSLPTTRARGWGLTQAP